LLTEEEIKLIHFISQLPQKEGKIIFPNLKHLKEAGLAEEEILEGLIMLNARGILKIETIPRDEDYKEKILAILTNLDLRYMIGKLNEHEYLTIRREANKILLGTYNLPLLSIAPSPIMLKPQINDIRVLLTELLNLLEKKEEGEPNSSDIQEIIKSIYNIYNSLEGTLKGLKIIDKIIDSLKNIKEENEETYLKYKIGDISEEEFNRKLLLNQQTLSQLEIVVNKLFGEKEKPQQKHSHEELELQLEILKARLLIGELEPEEYERLYQQTINMRDSTRRKIGEDIQVILSDIILKVETLVEKKVIEHELGFKMKYLLEELGHKYILISEQVAEIKNNIKKFKESA